MINFVPKKVGIKKIIEICLEWGEFLKNIGDVI